MSEWTSSSLEISTGLMTRLVAEQFPQWSDLAIRPVDVGGNDNRTFHLGNEMSIRVPSAPIYAEHLLTEQAWLPLLAPHLPLPIPTPIAMGRPGHGLSWGWLINRWLKGETATPERIGDLDQFANDLAVFLRALQSIDTKDAPAPGTDNFFRGGKLAVYDRETRTCIRELDELVNAQAAKAVWEAALQSKCSSQPTWIHGDVAIGNLLVNHGRLCAVIDFGQLAAGDPACDLVIAWRLFEGESRKRFRDVLCLDDDTWLRARAWALWKALLELRQCRQRDSAKAAVFEQLIDNILSE